MAEKLRPYIPSPRPVTGEGFPYYVDQELRKLATFSEQSKTVLELSEKAITGDSATLDSVATAQATAGQALSTQMDTLSTTVGGFNTSITTNTTSISGIQGKYGVKINNNGHVSGFGLISDANGATPTSEFIVQADKFKIETSSSGGSSPFSVVGNQVFIDQATIGTLNANVLNLDGSTVINQGGVLKVGAIDGGNINGGAVTGPKIDTDAVTTTKVTIDNITETNYVNQDSGATNATNNYYDYNNPYLGPVVDLIVESPCTVLTYAFLQPFGTVGSGTHAIFGLWHKPYMSGNTLTNSWSTLPSGGTGYQNAVPQMGGSQFTGSTCLAPRLLVSGLELTSSLSYPFTLSHRVCVYYLNWTNFRVWTNWLQIVSYR